MYLYYPTSQTTAYPPPPSCDSASIRRLQHCIPQRTATLMSVESVGIEVVQFLSACVVDCWRKMNFQREAKLALGKNKE